MKVIGIKKYPSLQSLFENTVAKQALKIWKDPSHILYPEHEVLASGRRYRASRYKSNHYKLSFLPTPIALLNNQLNSEGSTFLFLACDYVIVLFYLV